MILYRVLNDYDIQINAKENGLFSKKLINKETDELAGIIYNICASKGLYLNDKLLKESVNEHRLRYFNYVLNIDHLIQMAQANNSKAYEIGFLLALSYVNNDIDSFNKYFYELANITSEFNNHVYNGSKPNYRTNWLSFTKDFKLVKDFYNRQKIHEVAIIDGNVNLCSDKGLIALDLSNKDDIYDNLFLVKKSNLNERTSINSVIYSYSTRTEEVIYYNYIPSDRILNVLKSLDIDLLYNNMINEDVIKNKELMNSLHNYLLRYLQLISYNSHNNKLIKVFNNCYYYNYNIDKIIDVNL